MHEFRETNSSFAEMAKKNLANFPKSKEEKINERHLDKY